MAHVRLVILAGLVAAAAACVPTPAGLNTPPPGSGAQPSATAAGGQPSAVPTPDPAASPSFVRPTPNPSPTFRVHEVTVGESLTSIARLYGTTARSIAYWNRATYPSLDPDSTTYEPNRIEVGWILQLIPTEVVDEDELPDPTPSPDAASAPPVTTAGPS